MFLYVRSYFINPRINLSQRNWVLASNSNFPISISLQPNFKLTDFSILVISEWLLVTSSSGTGRYGTGRYGTGRYGTGRYGGKECTGVQEGRYWRIPIEYPCFLRFYSVPIGVAPHYLNGELHFLLQDRVCLVHSNPFLEADRVENRFKTSQDPAFYFSMFLVGRGWGRNGERPQTLDYFFLFLIVGCEGVHFNFLRLHSLVLPDYSQVKYFKIWILLDQISLKYQRFTLSLLLQRYRD